MVTLAISMIMLGIILTHFSAQYKEHKYETKRAEIVKELDFVLKYISKDLQSALIPSTLLNNGVKVVDFDGSGTGYTTALRFTVWDQTFGDPLDHYRVQREYIYDGRTLFYSRDSVNDTPTAILGEVLNGNNGIKVTHFRIFQDDLTDRSGYPDIPPALPYSELNNSSSTVYDMPSFTIALEIEIDFPRPNGLTDILGVANGDRIKLSRFIQVHPHTLVKY